MGVVWAYLLFGQGANEVDRQLSVWHPDNMKSAAFNTMIAQALATPEPSVITYARRLKESGLMATGARGRHAPEMTPLDAARITIAILTTDSPAECAERVRRFGQLRFSPDFKRSQMWLDTITPEHFASLFKGETLEEVLAYLFGLPASIGIEESCKWFDQNVFHLRVHDFDVLAELFQWKMEGSKIAGELVVPFKGSRSAEGFTPIKGGVRTERSISSIHFLEIGLGLLHEENDKREGA